MTTVKPITNSSAKAKSQAAVFLALGGFGIVGVGPFTLCVGAIVGFTKTLLLCALLPVLTGIAFIVIAGLLWYGKMKALQSARSPASS